MAGKPEEHFQEAIKSLKRRMVLLDNAGFLETGTRILGYQVLSRMALQGSFEVVTCWEDMGRGCVLDEGGQLVSCAAPDNLYHLVGALQQLQRLLGVVSHVTKAGVDNAETVYRERGYCAHFTEELEVDACMIQGTTLLIFRLLPGFGLEVDRTVNAYLSQATHSTVMPSWVME